MKTCQQLLVIISTLAVSDGFVVPQRSTFHSDISLRSSASDVNNEISRTTFLASSLASASALLSLSIPQIANAEDETTTTITEAAPATATATATPRSIQGCPKSVPGKPSNCIATSNIKQLDTYLPPWTFETTPSEAFARLKGLIKSEPYFTIVETNEDDMFLAVEVKRLNALDRMEFLVRADDKVIVFKSSEISKEDGTVSGVSDFGANRQRMEILRKNSGGVFKVMGEGLTADSFDGGAFGKRNGVGGQLKAFYGLNSGQGYESVFEK